jgi:hypothetical protein
LKNNFISLAIIFCAVFLFTKISFAQIVNKDSLPEVSASGFFNGEKVTVGNFNTDVVYKINNYCIALTDITESLADSLRGKNILVTGKLKIVVGKTFPAKESNNGIIYEPYKEADRKYIIEPKFTIISDQ